MGADGDGTPSLPFGHARCVAGDPRLCPLPWEARGDADGDGTPSLPQEATRVSLPRMAATERGPPVVVATSCDPPVVSGRWRVLGAALRRAIASRRAVPADVKDQLSRPCKGKLAIIIPHFPAQNKRDFGRLKFCARVRGTANGAPFSSGRDKRGRSRCGRSKLRPSRRAGGDGLLVAGELLL